MADDDVHRSTQGMADDDATSNRLLLEFTFRNNDCTNSMIPLSLCPAFSFTVPYLKAASAAPPPVLLDGMDGTEPATSSEQWCRVSYDVDDDHHRDNGVCRYSIDVENDPYANAYWIAGSPQWLLVTALQTRLAAKEQESEQFLGKIDINRITGELTQTSMDMVSRCCCMIATENKHEEQATKEEEQGMKAHVVVDDVRLHVKGWQLEHAQWVIGRSVKRRPPGFHCSWRRRSWRETVHLTPERIGQMQSMDEVVGLVLEGESFMRLCRHLGHEPVKLTSFDEVHRGYPFRTGFNRDPCTFVGYGLCCSGGFYFTFVDCASKWLIYGQPNRRMHWQRAVLSFSGRVYVEGLTKCKAECFELGEREMITSGT